MQSVILRVEVGILPISAKIYPPLFGLFRSSMTLFLFIIVLFFQCSSLNEKLHEELMVSATEMVKVCSFVINSDQIINGYGIIYL